MDIGFVVTGDREVSLRFEQFPTKAHDAILAKMNGLKSTLEQRVREAMPKGKTHELENSVEGRVYDDNGRIRAWVSVDKDFAKAAALEYGSHKQIKVNLSAGAERAKQAHRSLKSDLLLGSTAVADVYTRQTNLVAERFLRTSVASLETEAVTQLQQAVQSAVEAGE